MSFPFRMLAVTAVFCMSFHAVAQAQDAGAADADDGAAQQGTLGIESGSLDMSSMGGLLTGGMMGQISNPVPFLASPRGPSIFLLSMPASNGSEFAPNGKPKRKTLTQKLQEQNKARQR